MATIFIADGNEMMRKLMTSLLESHEGWLVCGEAVDGQEAVEKVSQLRPDVVVLDLAMPTLNGLLAAREISKRFPGMPIILHTLHDFPEMVAEAKKYGVGEVVGKGEGGDKLLCAVEMLLETRPDGWASLLEDLPLRFPANSGAAEGNSDEPAADAKDAKNTPRVN